MAATIETLREKLFETIDDLKKAKDVDYETVQRANAIIGIAQALINSAKVECDFLKVTGRTEGTGFISVGAVSQGQPRLIRGKASI